MIAALACVLAALAADPSAEPGTAAAEVQGTWRLVSVEAEAGSVELPEARPLLTIEGDRVLFGGEEFARVSADSTTQPKVFDLRFPDPQRTYEGIYTASKDSLKVCLNGRAEGVKERPNSFALVEQPVRRLLTFERVTVGQDVVAGNGFVGMALRRDEDRNEILIQNVLEGSPAKKAGLRPDDVLVNVAGDAVTDLRSAVEAVRRAKPRSELPLRIRRGQEEMEFKVTVGVVPFPVLAGLE